MEFSTLDLPAPVMDGIRDAGFVTATPIQEAALPLAPDSRRPAQARRRRF